MIIFEVYKRECMDNTEVLIEIRQINHEVVNLTFKNITF